ncbi:MAG TPA: glycosyltransferase family 9 protein, partial [Verrucomicrobiae bacterium]|nr:glycosyltransferase family 9 protein [Verrucomicrobiae bacterium]
DFTTGDRAAIYSLCCGARDRLAYVSSYNRFDWKRRAYTLNVPRPDTLLHQVERHLNMLAPLGIKAASPQLVLRLTPGEMAWARAQQPPDRRATAVGHFVANWLFKCWEDAKAAAVIDWLQREKGFGVWLTSGPAAREREKAESIFALCREKPSARIGDMTLRQLAALIATSGLFVGVDSAPTHMAAALGVPTVAVFGPTLDQVWSPWTSRGTVARSPCQCIAAGKVLCDRNKLRECFAALPVSAVQQAIEKVLAKN